MSEEADFLFGPPAHTAEQMVKTEREAREGPFRPESGFVLFGSFIAWLMCWAILGGILFSFVSAMLTDGWELKTFTPSLIHAMFWVAWLFILILGWMIIFSIHTIENKRRAQMRLQVILWEKSILEAHESKVLLAAIHEELAKGKK